MCKPALFNVWVCCIFLAVGSAGKNMFAQRIAIEPFVGDRPLPTQELYGMEEDDFGNIWVASDAGLIKITGNKVTHYTRQDGLYEDVILDLCKGPRNTIWATGLNGSVTLVRNDSLFSLAVLNKQLQTYYTDALGAQIQSMAADSGGNFYFYNGLRRVFVVTAESRYTRFRVLETDSGVPRHLLINGKIVRGTGTDLNMAVGNRLYRIPYRFKSLLYCLQSNSCASPDGSYLYFSGDRELVEIKNFRYARTLLLDDPIIGLNYIDDKLYIGKLNSGYCCLRAGGELECDDNVLSDKGVTGVLKDREGNFWFSTYEKGLYVCRSPRFNNVYQGEVNVRRLVPKKEGPVILLDGGRLLDEKGTYRNFDGYVENIALLNDVLYINDDEYLLTNMELLKATKSHGVPVMQLAGQFSFRDMAELETGRLVISGTGGVLILEDGTFHKIEVRQIFYALLVLNDSTVWLGSQKKGIYTLQKRKGTWNLQESGESYRVNSLVKAQNNIVAVGTNDRGVLLLDERGTCHGRINGTPSRIQTLAYADSLLYIGTKEGLYVHDFRSRANRVFNTLNDIPFDEVVDLLLMDRTLYVAGKRQVLKIKIDDLLSLKPRINIRIAGVEVNDIPIRLSGLDSLAHSQNSLLFRMENSSFRAAKNLSYQYRIYRDGKEISSHETRADFFNLYLEPGNYRLYIRARDLSSGTWSDAVVVPIYIRFAFYQTGWFLVLVIGLSVMLLGVLFYVSLRAVKTWEYNKRKLMAKMHALENTALQSQMNPHFIFNAINSIQGYILVNDRKNAHHYLAEFAKLIRLTLDHSRKKNVSLAEEVKLLRIYISLEEQRISDPIHFTVSVDESVDTDETYIPALLLQPLVENAIWHGLANITREKHITIWFYLENSHLLIKVRDNGKGLSADDSAHRSHGLNIIRERIKLAYRKRPDFTYFDIQNNTDEAGVTVKIVLPLELDTWQ